MTDSTLLKAAGLWCKTSRNGRTYLVGRLGGLRVLVFENAERQSDNDPTHLLMVGEAPDRPRQDGRQSRPRLNLPTLEESGL